MMMDGFKTKILRGNVMASNGYVRACCSGCIFYRVDREFGNECMLYDEMWKANNMRWVSALDCERYPYMKEKYYEECEHYASKKEIRNQIREKFGIKKVD